MFEQQVSYYLLNPFRSQGWQSKCTVHLITRQEKEIMEECSNFPQHLKKSFCLRWGQQQILVLQLSQNPGRQCKETGEPGFPQNTRVMHPQIRAVVHRGTVKWKFHPKMNTPELRFHAYLGDMAPTFFVWNLTCLYPGVYAKQVLLSRLANIPN